MTTEDEIDLSHLYENFKKTSLYRFLRKSWKLSVRYWWLVLLLMLASGLGSYYYQKSQGPLYETIMLVKSTQLNSDISEFIIDDLFDELNAQMFDNEDGLLVVEIQDGKANIDLLQQLEKTSMVYPLELSDWLKFQDYLKIRLISNRPVGDSASLRLIRLLENNSYISELKLMQEEVIQKKIQVLKKQLDKGVKSDSMSIKDETELKLQLVDLQHSFNTISSAELVYHTKSKPFNYFDRIELIISILAGFMLSVILMHIIVRK